MEQSWLKLIEYIKAHPYCEMKITFRDGKPLIAEEVKDNIKFS